MVPRVRIGLTLVEVAVALAIGLSVLVVAASAMRLSMQTITKANRLSLENTMMRTAIVAGLNEADFWQQYDPVYEDDHPLRDAAEPFNALTVMPELDMHLIHRPETWWRDFGYYDTFTKDLSAKRWGDYSLAAGVGHEVEWRSALAEYQDDHLGNLGFFAALDLAPAGLIWKHRDADGDIADYYQTYEEDGTDSDALYNDHHEVTTIAGDRHEVTWRGVHGLTTQMVRANQGQHVWFLPRFLDGEESGSDETDGGVSGYFTDKWSTTKYLKNSADAVDLVAQGSVPEDWPTVRLSRISWLFRATPTYWLRVAVTDPLTGRQMALSMEGSGTSLGGARLQRLIFEATGELP